LTLLYDSVIVSFVSTTEWTLEELGARVKDALDAAGYVPADSARVRAVPDARTIRYYATLGIVDRPELSGRTALYGERHLLQLVAVKRLQAEGLTLAEVQARLTGLPTATLRALAKLPETLPEPEKAEAPVRRDFWRSVPDVAREMADVGPSHDVALAAEASEDPSLRLALELGGGVTLIFGGDRRPTHADVEALRRAAGPLLRAIEDRGLLGHRRVGEPGTGGVS
jgi:DNA-binding transcriptional MerR regulator